MFRLAITIVLVCAMALQCACLNRAVEKSADGNAGFTDNYSEAYDLYPAIGSSGVAGHLVRSHSTAILVRPASSVYELTNRLLDQMWDTGRRLEVRLLRFPALDTGPAPELSPDPVAMNLTEWEAYLDGLCGDNRTTAEVDFLIGGERFYSELERAISEAGASIDLQIYLFDNDDVAGAIADRLRARSREIKVRVIFDGLGTYLSHFATAETHPEAVQRLIDELFERDFRKSTEITEPVSLDLRDHLIELIADET